MSFLARFSYYQVLKNNPPFRTMWYGQVVSELGDWLNSIAIYALLLQITGSGMAMAAAMMAKLLPIFFVSPVAGVVIDRIKRKTVMFTTDLLRFLIVLGFLGVHDSGDLWLLYTLVVLEISMSGFFEPARNAIIPSLIRKPDLVTANALSGSTWSVMLAFGSAVGGVVVSLLGIRTAFIIDAFTFLVSALFVSRIPGHLEKARSREHESLGGVRDYLDLLRHLASEPIILVLALLKSGLALAGGIMTLIPLYANQLYARPSAVSMAIGILFASRGVGAALGPILIRRLFGEASRVLQKAIAAAFFLGALCLFLFGHAASLWATSLSIGLVMFFGSTVWVFSTALIHLEAQDRFLGRIFSFEMGLLTLVMAASNGTVGWAVDRWGMSPSQVASGMAVLFAVPGVLWSAFILFVRNRLKQGKCVGSVSPMDPSGFNPFPPTPVGKN